MGNAVSMLETESITLFQPAGAARRFVAYITDGIILEIACQLIALLFVLLFRAALSHESLFLLIRATALLLCGFYFIYWQYEKHATPGMRLMQIKIISTDSLAPSLAQIALRLLPLLILMLGNMAAPRQRWVHMTLNSVDAISVLMLFCAVSLICFLSIAFTRDKQGFHDRWTHCAIVKDEEDEGE